MENKQSYVDASQLTAVINKLIEDAVLAEREQCAKVCDDIASADKWDYTTNGFECAAAIRNRGYV